MSRTAADVTPEEMEVYRATHRRLLEEREALRIQRQALASDIASRCANMLRERYGATRVVLFGSLARGTFGLRSDIDIAVWGVSSVEYFDVLPELMAAGGEIEVNLVRHEAASASLRESIARDGVEL